MMCQKKMKHKLEKAALTLRAMPKTSKTAPMGHKSTWPDMIRKTKNGAILRRGTCVIVPNNEDITDCYVILDILYEITDMQRQLLWARANHISWQALQHRFGRSRTHLNRLYNRALSLAADRYSEIKIKNS